MDIASSLSMTRFPESQRHMTVMAMTMNYAIYLRCRGRSRQASRRVLVDPNVCVLSRPLSKTCTSELLSPALTLSVVEIDFFNNRNRFCFERYFSGSILAESIESKL